MFNIRGDSQVGQSDFAALGKIPSPIRLLGDLPGRCNPDSRGQLCSIQNVNEQWLE